MSKFPLIGFGWIVAALMCWLMVYAMRSAISRKSGKVVTTVFYSVVALAMAFSIYFLSTVTSVIRGESFIAGFIAADMFAVLFLAGQTMVPWFLFLKKAIPAPPFVAVTVLLATVDIAARTAALNAPNGLTLLDGSFVKGGVSSVVPIIETYFLCLLLLTGLYLLWRAVANFSGVVRMRYAVTGALATIGSISYIADNLFIQSSGLSDGVAIASIVLYPLLAVTVFTAIRLSDDLSVR